jgi:hypothetical protein
LLRVLPVGAWLHGSLVLCVLSIRFVVRTCNNVCFKPRLSLMARPLWLQFSNALQTKSFLCFRYEFSAMCCGLTLALGRAGFRPGSRGRITCCVLKGATFAWCVPNGATFAWCVPKGATVSSAKDPKPFPPRSTALYRPDSGNGEADQLAGLKQGPPFHLSVSTFGQPAGGGR